MASTSTLRLHAHDPFRQPSGLLHIKATILWSVLPEILLMSAWSALVCAYKLDVSSSFMTTYASLLALVLTLRANSAYQSYQDGRVAWTNVMRASRTFARVAWLHVPEYTRPPKPGVIPTDEEKRLALVEKKTYINLVGAFSVALKHYVRGEGGICYIDLYPLVSFLPRYRIRSAPYLRRPDLVHGDSSCPSTTTRTVSSSIYPLYADPYAEAVVDSRCDVHETASPLLPPPRRESSLGWHLTSLYGDGGASAFMHMVDEVPDDDKTVTDASPAISCSPSFQPVPKELDVADVVRDDQHNYACPTKRTSCCCGGPGCTCCPSKPKLLPARNPPPRGILDFLPFVTLIEDLFDFLFRRRSSKRHHHDHRGRGCPNGKKRPLQSREDGDNVPMEIILFLSGWIAALQARRTIPDMTAGPLLAALQQLSDALTAVEAILLRPIPMAYSLYLRHVVWLFLVLLPTQLRATSGWFTILLVVVATFMYLGMLKLSDQIENPFGYNSSDLDLEFLVRAITKELRELTAHSSEEVQPEEVCVAEENRPFAGSRLNHKLSAMHILATHVPLHELRDELRRDASDPLHRPVEDEGSEEDLADADAYRWAKAHGVV
ncbi:hypothetical protein JCM8097_003840 [Rhodosporidiobolus ruineniae]